MPQKHLHDEMADYEGPLEVEVNGPDEMRLDAATGGKMGDVELTDEVIASIVERAVETAEGGVELAHSGTWFGGSKRKENVEIRVGEDRASCEIRLQVKMPFNAPMREVASGLQHHVKDVVERMTGRPVSAVHVKIVGLTAMRDDDRA